MKVNWKRTVQPTTELVTLAEAKKQLEIGLSSTSHDSQLNDLIVQARDQVEHDTGIALQTQTIVQYFDSFEPMKLAVRPIQSVSSIQYYDSSNQLQTLASTIYSLNEFEQEIVLAYDQTWPAYVKRWDSIKVTYVAGYETAAAAPQALKRACLLLIGHYFEHRGDDDRANDLRTYEQLVRRHFRSSYP
mgnify:CR=1 FL=1